MGDIRVLTDLQEIKAEAVSHFDSFLNGQPKNFEGASMEYLQEAVDYRCSTEVAADLVRPVQGDEIKRHCFLW